MFSKVLRPWHKKDERFVVKYQILAQTSYVIVVFSLADVSIECQQYIVSGYKQIDHGVTNYEVRLPKKSTANIESIDGSAEVKPSDERPILYRDLKKQNSIHYKITLQAPSAGDHLLQLRFRSGDSNIFTHPFHVTLEEETYTVPDSRRAESTSQMSPSDTQEHVIPVRYRPEEKFLVKYQILSKGPLVVVVYSLQDTAHACQKFTASGYKCIESGARNYEVRLPRFSKCISSIESSDPSVEVSPQFEMPLPYTDLKNQTSIQHKVTLLTSSGGRHLLNLCLKRENEILRSEPFHVTLGADDLYDSTGANLAARDVVSNFLTNEGEPGSRQPLKSEEKFRVNYQILTKGAWVVVIYSLAETTDESHQFISGGYQCIQHGISNHEVRFPHWSPCTSSIESIDGSVIITPEEGKNLSYLDLKNQKSVHQSVALLAQSGGTHLLHLRIRNGDEILHTAPFQVILKYEDLYAGEKTSQPQPSNTNQRQEEVGVPTADQFHDDIDDAYEIPEETQPKVPVGVIRRFEIEQYDEIPLRQSPITRPKASIYNPPPLPVNNSPPLPVRPDDFDDDEWDDDDNLYEYVDAEKNSEIPTVTRPQLPVGVIRRPQIEQYDDILLRQAPIPRARTSIYNSSLFTRLHDFDDEEWDDDETIFEDRDAERNSEMLTATRPRFPSPELIRLEQQDTTPLVSRTENTMPSLSLKPGTVRGILENHNVDNYWPLLERSGVKSVEDLARLDKKKLEEFGVKTVGDRIRIMNAVESCKSPFICSSKEKEENFAVEELLGRIGMINFKPLFKQERISMELLNALEDQDFKDIGITQENDRKAIKQALEGMEGYCDLECHKYDNAN
uniref:uncharacterized protein LOC120328896 n=1 Tax=Styela clava TaxID=7725 RepID=UPI001939BEB2|nr:uncharacterized protein LOC120328896 [Styela clava]